MDLRVFTDGLTKELGDRKLLGDAFMGIYHFPFNFVSTTRREGDRAIVREELGLRFLTTRKDTDAIRSSRCAIGRVFAVLNNSLEDANIIGASLAIAYENAIEDYLKRCAVGVKAKPDNGLASRVELFQDNHMVDAIKAIRPPDPTGVATNAIVTNWCCRVIVGWNLVYA